MKADLEKTLRVARDHLGLVVRRIHPRLYRKAYLRGASVLRCDGKCCLGGASVSVTERDNILAHAGIVRGAMTSRARRDPSSWFGKRVSRDEDYSAGQASFTRVVDGACAFYRDDGLCALQVAGEKCLQSGYALKPSVCILWPLAVRNGALEPGTGLLTRRRECCSPVREGGRRTLLEVIAPCARSLRRMSRPENSRGGAPPCAR